MQIYVPLLLLIGFVALNAVGITLLSHLITRGRPNPIKDQPYESGIPPLGDARERFSVKFYMVAMLFIVFDIETVFMLPWGVWFQRLSCSAPLLAGDACPRARSRSSASARCWSSWPSSSSASSTSGRRERCNGIDPAPRA